MSKPPTDQYEFDGVFVLSQKRQNLTIQEVAEGLSVTSMHVRNLLDSGEFVCGNIALSDQTREHLRIARYSVVAWWREEQARKGYEPPFYQTVEVKWWREELRKKRSGKNPDHKQQ